MAMSNITYKSHCYYARMTPAHNYAQCCDGVGGEKAWCTLASASGGETVTVGCVVLLHWATLGWNRTMLYNIQMCGHLTST